MSEVNPPIDAPFESIKPEQKGEIGMSISELLDTGLRNFRVVGIKIDGENYFGLTGEYGKSAAVKLATKDGIVGEHHTSGAALCFDSSGRVLWRDDFTDEKLNGSVSVFPNFVDITGKGDWALSFSAGVGRQENIYLKTVDGRLIWKTPVVGDKPWANGSCVFGDFNNDGREEIVYGACSAIMCVDAQAGKVLWVYDDRVSICHGRLAAGDVDGDGQIEIVFGTEYSDDFDKCLSSMVILDGNGKVLSRKENILGDLGSTRIHLADINNDGKPEIIAAAQNLCWNTPRHPCGIMVFDGKLDELYPPIAAGAPRWAVGDFDSDGHTEAVGITDYRDGGPLEEFTIVCSDLTAGAIKWRVPVSRCWLTGDPIVGDFDGDGKDEIALTTNYATGYAHQPGTDSWSDMYIVKPDGRIIFVKTFADMMYQPLGYDINNDGKLEILAGCYDGKVYVCRLR